MKKSIKKLTAKHKRFVRKCFELRSHTAAYMDVYNTRDRHSAAVNASRLLQDPLVAEYYREIEEALDADGIASVSEVMQTFSSILRREAVDYSVSTKGEVAEHPPKLTDVIRAGEAILKRRDAASAAVDMAEAVGVLIMPPATDGDI